MKKKIFLILFLSLVCLCVVGCTKDKEDNDGNSSKNKKEETKVVEQNLKVIEKNEDGSTKKGTLEGYTFTETTKKTERVKIEMENGHIILIVLSNSDAPKTIANFQKLVSEKYYDGLIFHRVIENFMIQTGDPTGTGSGGSEKTIKGEFAINGVKNDLSHTRGVISMARRGPSGSNPETADTMNSASSQFFIVHQDSTFLDGKYASFGRVFAGLDVIDEIATVETDNYDKPLTDQKIKSIRFITIEKAE